MSIYRSVVVVNVLMAVGIVVGFLNNIFIAAFFGLSRAVDAYYAALVLPMLFMALCIDYLGKNFLPVFTRAQRQGPEAASELASSVVTIVAGAAIVVTALLIFFREPIFSALLPGFSAEDAEIVRNYFIIMAPVILLMVINTFHEYICQAEARFIPVATVRVALPTVNLAVILAANRQLGEYCLPVGYLLGNIVAFVMLAKAAAYRFRPRFRIRDQWEKTIFMNSFALMASGVFARSHSIITNYFGSLLGGGAIAGIQLSAKLASSVQEASTSGIRMVAFARASTFHVDDEHERLGHLYNRLILTIMLVLAPVISYICLHSEPLVRLIFFRGEFTEDMVALVSLALLGLMPSTIFFSVNPILSNAFYAMNMIRVPIVVMPLGALTYLVFAALSYSEYGVLGLVLSMTAWSGVIFVILLSLLGRRLPQFNAVKMLRKLVVYAALGLGAYWLPIRILRNSDFGELATMVISGVVGTGLYWLLLALLRDEGLNDLYGSVRELLARRSSGAPT